MNYVLYGEEHFLLEKARDRIIHEHIKEEAYMNTVTYNAAQVDMNVILDDARTIPFFSDEKVIIVDHATFLSASDDTKMELDALIKYLEEPMDTTILIFIGEFAKLDARKKIVKLMQKKCKVLAFPRLDDSGKINYIRQELEERNLHVSKDALQELNRRLPLDIASIRHELEKLELLGDDISLNDVQHLVTRPLEEDVFALVNAVVKKDVTASFHIWKDLQVQNKDAIYLIALLASQFHFLFQVKTLSNQGYTREQITSELKAHPYRVKLSLQTCASLELSYILDILNRLATLDQKLKSGQLDKKMGFEIFLIDLMEGKKI